MQWKAVCCVTVGKGAQLLRASAGMPTASQSTLASAWPRSWMGSLCLGFETGSTFPPVSPALEPCGGVPFAPASACQRRSPFPSLPSLVSSRSFTAHLDASPQVRSACTTGWNSVASLCNSVSNTSTTTLLGNASASSNCIPSRCASGGQEPAFRLGSPCCFVLTQPPPHCRRSRRRPPALPCRCLLQPRLSARALAH